MTTPVRSLPSHSTRSLAVCALAATACFAAPARAADDAPPAPPAAKTIGVRVTKNDIKFQPSKAGAENGGGSNGKVASAGNQNTDLQSQLTYTITVTNSAKVPAKGLTVEYHFFNKTVNTNNGNSSYSLDDITSTESVDVAPGKTATVVSLPIPQNATTTVSGGGGASKSGGKGGKGVSASPTQSSSITTLLGYRVEVRFGDKLILAKSSDPMDLQQKVDQLNKLMNK